MTPTGESPVPPPPPPRRRIPVPAPPPAGVAGHLVSRLFAVKGVFTAVSAVAVMAVLPWVTDSLRTAVAETGTSLPPVLAWTLDRPWILFLLAAEALISGICMVLTRRGRVIHLTLSSLTLAALVLFLGLCLMVIVRSMAAVATGA